MAKIQSPATVAVLLKKAKATYQKKKPDVKSKPEARHAAVVKDLQRLRLMARQKSAGAQLAKPFEARKRLLLKRLTEHRKKLNSAQEKNEDANKAQLPAYLKALLRLTVALVRLDYASLSAAEETVNLEGLEDGDPAELDRLDELSEEALQALEREDDANLPAGAGEEEDEEPSVAPTARPAPSGTAVLKRLLALTGAYKEALARKDPEAAGLQGLYDRTRKLIDDKDFVQADTTLDELESLLAAPRATSAPAPAGGGVAVVKRLLALTGPYNAALARKGPEAVRLQGLYGKARALVDGKDFAPAVAVLDELEVLLAPAGKPGAGTDPTVKPGQTAAAWNAARAAIDQQISRLQSALQQTKDPDFLYLAENGPRKLAKQLQAGLEAALDAFDKSTAESRPEARAKVEALLPTYRTLVAQNPIIGLMDDNPFGQKLGIRKALGAALEAIQRMLQK
jgi:hypothetical protein